MVLNSTKTLTSRPSMLIPMSHACNTVLNKGLEVKVFVELSTIHNKRVQHTSNFLLYALCLLAIRGIESCFCYSCSIFTASVFTVHDLILCFYVFYINSNYNIFIIMPHISETLVNSIYSNCLK